MIEFLQAIVLVLTIALQPSTPPETRDYIFTSVIAIMQQVQIENPNALATSTSPMNQTTPEQPTPAPSAPATEPTPSPEPSVTAPPTDFTPNIEFLAEGNSLRWKTFGVQETLKCTLDGKEVEQEGEAMVDSGEHTLRCVGVKTGSSAQKTITV